MLHIVLFGQQSPEMKAVAIFVVLFVFNVTGRETGVFGTPTMTLTSTYTDRLLYQRVY